jgi:aquaporin Z
MTESPAADAAEEFTDELEADIWSDEPAGPSLISKMLAEVVGTFILVLLGVGAALLSGLGNNGTLTVGLAFGVAVIIGAIAFGAVSGAHFNPAITLGVWLAGRFPGRDVVPYVLAQVIGALFAGAALYFTLLSGEGLDGDSVKGLMQTAANGFGEHAPIAAQGATFGVGVALLIEVVATALLVLTVLGATSRAAAKGVAPFAIGLALAILVVFAIPFTNAALNPARASATALFAGDWAITQLWLFWVAPLIGGAIVGLLYRAFAPVEEIEIVETIEVIED